MKTYRVFVPVVKWVSIPVTAWSPGEALENAGAIAHQLVADNPEDHEKVVDSSEISWIAANVDGSSPNRYEKIWQPRERAFVWGKKGTLKRGYGY